MKNCDEMVNNLFERREQYVAKQKRKRKMMIRRALAVCGVGLVALVGIGGWQSGWFHTEPPVTVNDSTIVGEKDCIGPDDIEQQAHDGEKDSVNAQENAPSTPGDNSLSADSSNQHLFVINNIVGETSATFPYRDPELHYTENWDLIKMRDYLGVDIVETIKVLPSGMGIAYIGTGNFTVTYENDGTLVEDRAAYSFEGNNGETVTVSASRLYTPYDCIYQLDSNNQTPMKLHNGDTIDLLVAAETKSDTTMEYAHYVVDFSYNGLFYRIDSENIASYQLDALIREITK